MPIPILRRLPGAVPVLAFFIFSVLRIAPGDPALMIAGDNANAERLEAIRADLGHSCPNSRPGAGRPCQAISVCRGSPVSRSRRRSPGGWPRPPS